jgi:hypothetical protein
MPIDFKKPKKIYANQELHHRLSGRVRCQPSRVVDLDVFSEFSEVVWSGWMLVLNISKFSKKLISHKCK